MREEAIESGFSAQLHLVRTGRDIASGIMDRRLVISAPAYGSLLFEVIENGAIVRTEEVPLKFILNYSEMLEKCFLYLDSVIR